MAANCSTFLGVIKEKSMKTTPMSNSGATCTPAPKSWATN